MTPHGRKNTSADRRAAANHASQTLPPVLHNAAAKIAPNPSGPLPKLYPKPNETAQTTVGNAQFHCRMQLKIISLEPGIVSAIFRELAFLLIVNFRNQYTFKQVSDFSFLYFVLNLLLCIF